MLEQYVRYRELGEQTGHSERPRLKETLQGEPQMEKSVVDAGHIFLGRGMKPPNPQLGEGKRGGCRPVGGVAGGAHQCR